VTMQSKISPISFLACFKIWWRFFLSFIAILLVCSLVTHLLLLAAVWLTQLLDLAKFAPKALVEVTHFGLVNSTLLHIVGLSSFGFFLASQITVFYLLLNHSTAIRKILYKHHVSNPYPRPITEYDDKTHSSLAHDDIKKL